MQKELERLESKLLRSIEKSAAKGKGESVVELSKFLEEVNLIQQNYSDLETQVESLRRNLVKTLSKLDEKKVNPDVLTSLDSSSELSAHQKGEIRRKNFLNEIQRLGIRLIHDSGVKYRRVDGGLVGIASATERAKDRWFLGLPKDNYATIVLLCEDLDNTVSPIVLPPGFVEEHSKFFSTSQDGSELKFNVRKECGRWMMSIPGQGSEDVSKMIDAFHNVLA